MGVSQAAVNWFDSYLGGRMQAVEISGVFSEFRSVTCGVPQGSILGPLLFLIYVNDMKAAVNWALFRCFPRPKFFFKFLFSTSVKKLKIEFRYNIYRVRSIFIGCVLFLSGAFYFFLGCIYFICFVTNRSYYGTNSDCN